MNERIDRDSPPTTLELVFDLVKGRLLTIVALILFAAAFATVVGFDFSVPRTAMLVLVTGLLLAPAGYMTGNYIVSMLWDPQYIFLVDLDARRVDGALYRFPWDHFKELEVTEGSLCEMTPHLYAGKNVDLEQMTAEGTWRGTLDDRDLLRALTKVEECRGQLEDDAKKGFALETQAFTIIRSCVRSATLSVVRTFERGTLPDEGDSIAEQVDRALERYDLDTVLDDDLEDVEPDPADLDDEPGAAAANRTGEQSEQSERPRAERAADARDPLTEAGADD